MSGHECSGDCKAYKDKDHPIPGRWEIGEWKFQRCPFLYMDHTVYWLIKGYLFMQQGFLPKAGGWMNQANKFNEAMQFIDANKKRPE